MEPFMVKHFSSFCLIFCLLLPLKLPFSTMFLIIAGTVTGIRLLAIHFRIQLPAAGHAKP